VPDLWSACRFKTFDMIDSPSHSSNGTGATGTSTILHASCVAFDCRAVLIIGPSGSGKSSLALQLLAYGAVLVADDRTQLQASEAGVLACAPQAIKGMIEARGVGILAAEVCSTARIHLIVDTSLEECDRLPQQREYNLLGHSIPLLHNVRKAYFPAAILQFIKGGRSA